MTNTSAHFYEDLVPVLEVLEITAPLSFSLDGEAHQVYPGTLPSLPGYPSHPLPANPLVRDMQSVLYNVCYARRLGEPRPKAGDGTNSYDDPAFLQKLAEGNMSRSRWEHGWQVYGLGANGQIFISKGMRQRTAVPGEFITTGPPGVPPVVGSVVSLQVQREANGAQPSWYFAYGDTLSDVWDEFTLLRFYFHCTDRGSHDLLKYLTTQLNRYQVPFRLKAPITPALYDRTDAVVLYVAKRYFHITARIIMNLTDDVRAGLRESVPLFTKRIASGVGFAEEPNTGESFGMHRCRLVAEGVVDAWQQEDHSAGGRMRAIAMRYASVNLKLGSPYLNPGSKDIFEVPTESSISV